MRCRVIPGVCGSALGAPLWSFLGREAPALGGPLPLSPDALGSSPSCSDKQWVCVADSDPVAEGFQEKVAGEAGRRVAISLLLPEEPPSGCRGWKEGSFWAPVWVILADEALSHH